MNDHVWDDRELWQVSTHVQHFPISIVTAVYGLHSGHCAAYLWEISHVWTDNLDLLKT